MATFAAEPRGMQTRPAKAPISSHPMFPAIVALWFAALLGLGTLILPTILLERLVTVTGIAALVPSAAPPLGFTARALLAVSGALTGAVLGLLLARQIAAGQTSKPRARFSAPEERSCRPISVHEEFGEEGLGGISPAAPASTKRRSLAIAEDPARSAYLEHVPLPGEDSFTGPVLPSKDEAEESDALDLGNFAESAGEPDRSPQVDFADLTFDPEVEAEVTGDGSDFTADALPFSAPSLHRQSEVPAFLAMQYDFEDEAMDDEPVEPHIETGTFGTPNSDAAERPFDPAPFAGPQLAIVETATAEAETEHDDGRPLDELGLVQLAARLGASIEKRRALRANGPRRPATAPVFTDSTEDFAAAGAADAAAARASFFAPASQQPKAKIDQSTFDGPAILQAYEPEPASELDGQPPAKMPVNLGNISFDEDEDSAEDDVLAASLALPRKSAPPSMPLPFAQPEAESDDEGGDESDYSSLLAMKNPFEKRQEFVRIEEPELADDSFETTVTFPSARQPSAMGDSPARPFDPPPSGEKTPIYPGDPSDAERELREALATLQRMSGAA